ncbi:MAG: di-heme oxidoredictase family protein, partial [Phycisphaerales bacterium]
MSTWPRIAVVSTVVFVAPFAQGRGPVAQPKLGDPLLGLTAAQLDRFAVGKTAFEHVLTEAEGLGPVFNKTACAGCHNNPSGGSGVAVVTRFGTMDGMGNFDPLAELGGSLLQAAAISDECAEQIPVEATIQAFRLTPSTLGFGLTEAISDADLLANADPDDLNFDGISGRAIMVSPLEDPGNMRVGRFGWKTHAATMLTFSAGASLNEMGLTNRFITQENDPNGINPPELVDCDLVPDDRYEDNVSLGNGMNKEFIDVTADFMRFSAPAPQTPKSGMTGEALFISIGCADCHLPQFTTADDPSLEDAIRNKVIHPYSDYLLHDMGLAGDGIVQGDAEAQEIRTMPLRGLRVRDPMWHDGRAAGGFFEDRIKQVVACHCASGSEAQASAQLFLSGTVANCPGSLPTGGDGFACGNPGIVKGGLDNDQ